MALILDIIFYYLNIFTQTFMVSMVQCKKYFDLPFPPTVAILSDTGEFKKARYVHIFVKHLLLLCPCETATEIIHQFVEFTTSILALFKFYLIKLS